MADVCPSLINFCHLRVARLDSDLTRKEGANNRYETNAGVEMSIKATIKSADKIEQENGCGDLCVTGYTTCDKVEAYELGLQVCRDELEFREMLVGGTLWTDTGETVGYSDPDPLAACNYGTIIEGWSIAWDGDQQALHPVSGLPMYEKRLFPRVRWVPGDETLAKGAIIQNYTGTAVPNTRSGLGPTCDWIQEVTGPSGRMYTTSLPAAVCGSQTLSSCSS